jgi:hypothetical protein
VAFQKCARENPASYLKIFALLVPRELKIEHANPTSGLSDEQLALMVAELEERIARRVAGESAKLSRRKPSLLLGEHRHRRSRGNAGMRSWNTWIRQGIAPSAAARRATVTIHQKLPQCRSLPSASRTG